MPFKPLFGPYSLRVRTHFLSQAVFRHSMAPLLQLMIHSKTAPSPFPMFTLFQYQWKARNETHLSYYFIKMYFIFPKKSDSWACFSELFPI